MTLIIADRVLETSTTTGAGALTLAGAVTGYRAASAVCANGDTLEAYIEAVDVDGIATGDWETGLYTWGTGGTLTIVGSPQASSTGSKISWAAGTKRVGIGFAAERLGKVRKIMIPLASSDETTPLTVGTAKVTFRMPCAFVLTGVRASVTTAPTGATLLTVDLNEGGTSVLSTKLTFDAGEKTTTTAVTPCVISDAALADDAEMTVDIDAVGSTIAGAGLKLWLIGYES